ncbi:MAG: hypothetical protein ABSC23_03590 [Bryobacteraceae bacterium]
MPRNRLAQSARRLAHRANVSVGGGHPAAAFLAGKQVLFDLPEGRFLKQIQAVVLNVVF